jgi:hypothetical protein
MGAQCVKEGSVYSCDFERLITSDPAVLELWMRDDKGNEIKDPEELSHFMALIRGEEPGGVMVAGEKRGGLLVNAEPVRNAYELVHKLESTPGKSTFLVRDTNAELKFGKAVEISLSKLGFDERADSAIRSVARALDIPYHRNVLQPEVIEWDGTAIKFISGKADATLKDIGDLARSQPNRGALLVFLALQLLQGLDLVHKTGFAVGDVSSANVLVFKQHGVPELKIVPGKNTTPAPAGEPDLAALMKGLTITGKVDLDVVPCAFVMPGSQLVKSPQADIWAAGSSLFEALTGVAYGCACGMEEYSMQLARLELLPPNVEPATFMKYFRQEMDVPGVREAAEDPFVNMDGFAAPFLDLVRQMLAVNPKKTKSAAQLLQHPLFDMKPHPRSGFPSFRAMESFVARFHKMSPEARWALLKEAADEVAGFTAIKELPHTLKYVRENLTKGLMKEFAAKYPGHQRQLSKALYEAIRITDRMLRADTPYNEYARLMLANWVFSMDLGSEFPYARRQKLLEDTLDFCAQQFQFNFSPEDINKTKASLLATQRGKMFLEWKQASEAGVSGADALAQVVSQALSSGVWAEEQKALVGRRVYISAGRYSTQAGTVERVVGQGEQAMLFVDLDSGEKVAIERDNVRWS